MTPRQELEQLCLAHGVPPGLARRLLPLLEQSRRAPPTLRARLVGLVERSLAAQRAELDELEVQDEKLGEACLQVLAKMLRAWP